MADVVFVALIVGFFALAWALAGFCERVLGPDPLLDATVGEAGRDEGERSEDEVPV